MKTSTITLILILVSTQLTAQNTQTKPADKLVERYEYVQAVQEYLKLVDKGKSDSYVQKQLGDCYYNIYNPTEAIKWYQQAISSGKQDPETYYRYAQMLKSDGKYEASNAQMKTFAAMVPTDSRAKIFNENPDYLPKLIDTEKLFDVEKMSINSERSDFGGVLYGNQLYFSSARNETLKKYGWNDEPFLDLYQSTYDSAQKKYTEPTAITELNTRFHEGPLTMTQDGNILYYSSESFN
jgi:tetratricopeptide (TPR) repeat protein